MNSITVSAARQLLAEAVDVKEIEIESISIEEANQRVLAEPVLAPYPVPAYRKSPYDGYAIPLQDTEAQDQSHSFRIVGVIGAGEVWSKEVRPGEAIRIMTGAPVPDSCDTVVMQERCEKIADDVIQIRGQISVGENIIPIGEECAEGTVLMEKGTRLNRGKISVMAGVGISHVLVYKLPSILLLTSGREVILPGEELTQGKIYNSNMYLLKGLLEDEGLTDIHWYHVSDDPKLFDQEVEMVAALALDKDVVISTGGVSVGDYDVMPALYERLGACTLYRKIQMRPGSASYAGSSGDTIFWGLSGNPSAAFNAYWLLVVDFLRKLKGETNWERPPIVCKLGQSLHKKNPFNRYVEGHIECENGELIFYPNPIFTSSALLGLSSATAIGLFEQGKHEYNKGDTLLVKSLGLHAFTVG